MQTTTDRPRDASVEAPQYVERPSDDIVLLSRRSGLRLTLRARWPEIDPTTGQRLGWKRHGIYVGFTDGVFRVPPGRLLADAEGNEQPDQVELHDSLDGGICTVARSWLLTQLENHRLAGDKTEGFWRLVEPVPKASDNEVRAVLSAVLENDQAKLELILAQERAAYDRAEFVAEVERALAELREREAAPKRSR